MKIKSFLFWTHLISGLIAGTFILILAVTGLLLTYEHQIVNAFAKREFITDSNQSVLKSIDEIAVIARERSKGAMLLMLNIENRENSPIIVHPIGGKDLPELTLNPYSGENFVSSSEKVKAFFETVVGVHRWLAFEGKERATGRQISGAANLIFTLLILTGIYLWLPRAWKWTMLRSKITFIKNPPPGKARDFNWHHVFSFWSLIPLVIVVSTAIVISYPWANAALYRAFGSEAPKQGGPAFFSDLRKDASIKITADQALNLGSLQQAVDAAKKYNSSWTKMNIFIQTNPDVPVLRMNVHLKPDALPEDMVNIGFDRLEKKVISVRKYEDMSAAEKARVWVRFAHTGEQYGFIGSTLAGIASLAAIMLVYTGFALALRRFQSYQQRKHITK